MKTKLLASALAIIIMNTATANEPITSKIVRPQFITHNKYIDHVDLLTDRTKNMTNDEKEQYYNNEIDGHFIGFYDDFEAPYEHIKAAKQKPYLFPEAMDEPKLPRFDRKSIEPKLSATELERRTRYLETLLDSLIKKMPPQNFKEARSREVAHPNGNGHFINIYYANKAYLQNIQPNYLMPKVSYVSRTLYSPDYDISDFGYDESINQQFEKEYETIYLHIKAAGLLRKLPGAYYPKSLLREHANQSGLTQFIKKSELDAKTHLNHDDLAVEFFGTYDAWITGFYQFLDNKITGLNIRK